MPKLPARSFRVTRAKRSSLRGRQALKSLISAFCVSRVIDSLATQQRDLRVGQRGSSIRTISALRVHAYWRMHQSTFGRCPSLRSVARLVLGRNARCRKIHSNEELSEVELSQLSRMSCAQGWG